MYLINQQDAAIGIPAKLVLGVHQQQASAGGLPLAKLKQLQGSCADLQTVGSAHEGPDVGNSTHIAALGEASLQVCPTSRKVVMHEHPM